MNKQIRDQQTRELYDDIAREEKAIKRGIVILSLGNVIQFSIILALVVGR